MRRRFCSLALAVKVTGRCGITGSTSQKSISCSNRMQGDGLESRFSYPAWLFCSSPFPSTFFFIFTDSQHRHWSKNGTQGARAHGLGVNEFRRGRSEEVSILKAWDRRRRSSVLFRGGHITLGGGYQPVHIRGARERETVCVWCWWRRALPVPSGEGGRLPPCHRNSSKHFLVATSKKTTRLFSYTR